MNPLNHVAIIMDGNGRWGLKYKKSRNAGHKEGLKTVEKIIKESIISKSELFFKDLNIKNLDIYIDAPITLAKKLLNWSPKVSRKKGMKMTFNYFQNLSEEKLTKIDHKDFSKHIKQ